MRNENLQLKKEQNIANLTAEIRIEIHYETVIHIKYSKTDGNIMDYVIHYHC